MDQLYKIAAELQDKAALLGLAQHTLSGGLTLTYQVDGDLRILSLTRYLRQASEYERAIVRDAFGVPAWVKYSEHYWFAYINGWGVLRITWRAGRTWKENKIAQGHLAPGWCLSRWQSLMNKFQVKGSLSAIPEAKLDQMLIEIYG
ncbi:MAG: hypothetical protein AAF485_01955 [Chloroflexota bacterium]